MGRKRTPGLFKRGGYWHIDKQIDGCRLRESTGTTYLQEAECYLARRTEAMRQAKLHGVRPPRTFREAATKYLVENTHKATLDKDAGLLKGLMPFIGDKPLASIHRETLNTYVTSRIAEKRKMRTINHGLKLVKRILNLAAMEWRDEDNLTWLSSSPSMKLLDEYDRSPPYPLTWEEQERLFAELPAHLRNMALFAVNTGVRDHVVCHLRWEWEQRIPELNTSVFLVPGQIVKNRQDRLIVLNDIASSVIESVRGQHPEYVFVYKDKPMTRMLNTSWMRARQAVGLSHVRVHDLKHTLGCRLRAAGVSFEDRQDLLGHKSGRITTHYSSAEVHNLIKAANRVCYKDSKSALTVLRLVACRSQSPHSPHSGDFGEEEKMG